MTDTVNPYPVRFNDESLLEFLREFNPAAEKYRYSKIPEKELEKPHVQTAIKYAYMYEVLHQESSCGQDKYDELFQDLQLIYGYHEPIQDYLHVYSLVHRKLLKEFLQIPGLEKLFNSQYFRYEWDMHLGINYQKHALTYYRDHFLHQVKNVHAMLVLLDKFDFLGDIVGIVKDQSNVIATYIMNAALHYSVYAQSVLFPTDTRYPDDSEDKPSNLYDVFEVLARPEKEPKGPEESKATIDLMIERIVLFSAVMSGLFHDIGYPIAYSKRRQTQLEEYLPTISYFLRGSSSYSRISSLLGNSLLYTIVPKDEIRKRYDSQDHGTLSALAFLLYFYESGIIHGLDPIQKASVDLAALTMYNHTLEYEITDKDAKDYYRPVYYRNPISFLFRVCDDLQEWQRLYFHLVDNRNWRVCPKCRTPVVHRTVWNSDGSVSGDVRICGCCSQIDHESFRTIYKDKLPPMQLPGTSKLVTLGSTADPEKRNSDITISNIRYRRLNHIKLCDWAEFRKPSNFLVYEVHYDCYGLLQMAAIDPSFAPHRASEFKKLRTILKNQDMTEQLVLSFVSTNPVSLKVKILGDFLKAYSMVGDLSDNDQRECLKMAMTSDGENEANSKFAQDILLLAKSDRANAADFYNKYHDGTDDAEQRKQAKNAGYALADKIVNVCFPTETKSIMGSHLKCYFDLLLISWDIQSNVIHPKDGFSMDDLWKEYVESDRVNDELISNYKKINRSSALDVLLEDFRDHAADGADYEAMRDGGKTLPDSYDTQYSYEEDKRERFCAAVKAYTSRDTYYPFKDMDCLDFYSDLYLFYVLSRTTDELNRAINQMNS